MAAAPRCVYHGVCLHIRRSALRTNIEIDDRLLAAAMRASGCKTKRATVEQGLRLLARKKAYRAILALRGEVQWEGDPDALRRAKRR